MATTNTEPPFDPADFNTHVRVAEFEDGTFGGAVTLTLIDDNGKTFTAEVSDDAAEIIGGILVSTAHLSRSVAAIWNTADDLGWEMDEADLKRLCDGVITADHETRHPYDLADPDA